MASTQYLALLRGINVGGGNIIKMLDLKACFEASNLQNVATYIQSGNVLFETKTNSVKLVRTLEQALCKTFSFYKARIVLCSHAKLREIVQKAPKGFGSKPQEYRYDVIYLREPLTATEAIKSVSVKPGVDAAFVGPDVLYFSRLIARASQSHLTRIIKLPIYQDMTIRNWNTSSKLLALMDARTPG
jgi:uncharacterized protein (DUF1697 family)